MFFIHAYMDEFTSRSIIKHHPSWPRCLILWDSENATKFYFIYIEYIIPSLSGFENGIKDPQISLVWIQHALHLIGDSFVLEAFVHDE